MLKYKSMKGIPREVVVKNRKITNSREIRLLRKNFSLNNYQQSILIGSLLGDGGLYSDGWNNNYRFVIDQGEKQKDYLFWKFKVFSNCCFSEPSYQIHNRSWRMRTISHKEFNYYANKFYVNRKKQVPNDIIDYLNPLSLAIWFMDDGTKGPSNGFTLNTQNFSYKENEHLKLVLAQKFSLLVSIHKDKKWWRLFINPKSKFIFENLVNSYIHSAMRYKLYAIDPVETTRRPPAKRG